MSTEADLMSQGRQSAQNGGWAGDNPWLSEPERSWWLIGFRTAYPANDDVATHLPRMKPVGFLRLASSGWRIF